MDLEKLDKKVLEYRDRFNRNVPIYQMPVMTDEELYKLLDKCIKTGKPIKVDDDDDPNILY